MVKKTGKMTVTQTDDGSTSAASGEVAIKATKVKDPQIWRDLAAYWVLGLCKWCRSF